MMQIVHLKGEANLEFHERKSARAKFARALRRAERWEVQAAEVRMTAMTAIAAV